MCQLGKPNFAFAFHGGHLSVAPGTLQVIGGSGTVALVVQKSSRHQICVCARLRVGVRVNVPGTPQCSMSTPAPVTFEVDL